VQNAKRHIAASAWARRWRILAACSPSARPRTAARQEPPRAAALQLACAVTLYLFGATSERPPAPAKPAGRGRRSACDPIAALAQCRAIVVLARWRRRHGLRVQADIVGVSSKAGLLRSLAIFYTVTT